MIVRVHLTPPPRGTAGGPGFVGVAIDVLRATSTLTAASALFGSTPNAVARFLSMAPPWAFCSVVSSVTGCLLASSPTEIRCAYSSPQVRAIVVPLPALSSKRVNRS